jgi:predicted lipoprotein with Yx(FWY)xxD motif
VRRALLAGIGLAAALAGCGASKSHEAKAQVPPGPAVRVAESRLGPILVDRRGYTLYVFASDKHGVSTCFGGCARVWPPALTTGDPVAGAGVTASLLSTLVRPGYRRQLVYASHPLYNAAGDTRPGALTGEGYLGSWQAVSPTGKPVIDPRQPKHGAY